MTPLVSQLWPQFMADPAFASCFGQVIVEHARMLRQSQQVIFTLRSAAPLDKGLCARLLASLQPDYEGFELKIENHFGYATLDEAALRDLLEEMKADGVPITVTVKACVDMSRITGHWMPIRSNGTFNAYAMIKGSSEYDTKEMSHFIDGIVAEAKELGIETLPPDELESMMKAWKP